MAAHFDLVDLRLMVNIADENNLSRGADRSAMSVPAASVRIKNLEDRLGAKLLFRTGQGVTLTAPGHAFVHHARLVLFQIEHLRNDLQEYAQGVKGHIRIHANTTAIEFLPAALGAFLAAHPNVNVELRERLSHDIVRAVMEGMTDIGIVAGNVRANGLQVLPYREHRLVVAVADRHPLAQHETVVFEETLDYEFVGLQEASSFHLFLLQTANALNKTLKIRIHMGNFEAVCRMIEAGIGMGVLPESTARRHSHTMAIRLIPLRDDWAVGKLKICIRSLQMLPAFARDLVDQLVAPDTQSGEKKTRPKRVGEA
jgi:DNA-binding transcriptional LysR family regulator